MDKIRLTKIVLKASQSNSFCLFFVKINYKIKICEIAIFTCTSKKHCQFRAWLNLHIYVATVTMSIVQSATVPQLSNFVNVDIYILSNWFSGWASQSIQMLLQLGLLSIKTYHCRCFFVYIAFCLFLSPQCFLFIKVRVLKRS